VDFFVENLGGCLLDDEGRLNHRAYCTAHIGEKRTSFGLLLGRWRRCLQAGITLADHSVCLSDFLQFAQIQKTHLAVVGAEYDLVPHDLQLGVGCV